MANVTCLEEENKFLRNFCQDLMAYCLGSLGEKPTNRQSPVCNLVKSASILVMRTYRRMSNEWKFGLDDVLARDGGRNISKLVYELHRYYETVSGQMGSEIIEVISDCISFSFELIQYFRTKGENFDADIVESLSELIRRIIEKEHGENADCIRILQSIYEKKEIQGDNDNNPMDEYYKFLDDTYLKDTYEYEVSEDEKPEIWKPQNVSTAETTPGQPHFDPQIPRKDAEFLAKFVYDVLMYTLPTCGFPLRVETKNEVANDYHCPNFIRITGVSVLRLCLVRRDVWRGTFTLSLKRLGAPVYNIEYFGKVFSLIVKMATEEGEEALQFNVELTLAFCSEMALFFFSEEIRFDFSHLISATVSNIINLIQPPWKYFINKRIVHPNYSEELQKLFYEFENIWEFSRWLENFIQRHAVPYKSTKDVTNVFYREVKRRWEGIVENKYRDEAPSNEVVKVNLGFLPKDVYNEVAAETSVRMPRYSEVARGKPSKSKESSEKGAAGGKKSSRRQSTGSGGASKPTAEVERNSKDSAKSTVEGEQIRKNSKRSKSKQTPKDSSEQAAQGGQSSKASLELGIEHELKQLSLGREGSSQERLGAIPKRK